MFTQGPRFDRERSHFYRTVTRLTVPRERNISLKRKIRRQQESRDLRDIAAPSTRSHPLIAVCDNLHNYIASREPQLCRKTCDARTVLYSKPAPAATLTYDGLPVPPKKRLKIEVENSPACKSRTPSSFLGTSPRTRSHPMPTTSQEHTQYTGHAVAVRLALAGEVRDDDG